MYHRYNYVSVSRMTLLKYHKTFNSRVLQWNDQKLLQDVIVSPIREKHISSTLRENILSLNDWWIGANHYGATHKKDLKNFNQWSKRSMRAPSNPSASYCSDVRKVSGGPLIGSHPRRATADIRIGVSYTTKYFPHLYIRNRYIHVFIYTIREKLKIHLKISRIIQDFLIDSISWYLFMIFADILGITK